MTGRRVSRDHASPTPHRRQLSRFFDIELQVCLYLTSQDSTVQWNTLTYFSFCSTIQSDGVLPQSLLRLCTVRANSAAHLRRYCEAVLQTVMPSESTNHGIRILVKKICSITFAARARQTDPSQEILHRCPENPRANRGKKRP